jgi:hypothetical protein
MGFVRSRADSPPRIDPQVLAEYPDPDYAMEPVVGYYDDWVMVRWTVRETDDGGIDLAVVVRGDTATVTRVSFDAAGRLVESQFLGEFPLSDPKFCEKVKAFLKQKVRQILAE